MNIKSFTLGPLQNNSYLLWDETIKDGVVIDPTFDSELIIGFAKKNSINISKILNTHCHFDHIAGNADIWRFFKAEIFINSKEIDLLKSGHIIAEHFGLISKPSPDPTKFISEGDEIVVGREKIVVIETPGHTKGGVSFYIKGNLFCGDTLFSESIGRTDLEGGDLDTLLKSIREKLFVLPAETVVHPGHGELTTIAKEVGGNPFLNDKGEDFV